MASLEPERALVTLVLSDSTRYNCGNAIIYGDIIFIESKKLHNGFVDILLYLSTVMLILQFVSKC